MSQKFHIYDPAVFLTVDAAKSFQRNLKRRDIVIVVDAPETEPGLIVWVGQWEDGDLDCQWQDHLPSVRYTMAEFFDRFAGKYTDG